MKKKLFIFFSFLILLIFSFLPPNLIKLNSQTLHEVKLAIGFIPHIQFTPLYVGIEKGIYKKYGIDLKIEYGFGIDIFSLLSTEKIDIGLSDSDQLIIAGSKGIELKSIFQYYQKYPVTIVAKKSKIEKIEDFVDKKIGTPDIFGTSFIGLLIFLNYYNLTNKVKIEKIGYTQIASLTSDKVDAAVCFYNNEPVQMEENGINLNYWNVKDISDIVGASFITSNKTLTRKKDIIDNFIVATTEAFNFTTKNIDEAYEIGKKYVKGIDNDKIMKKVLIKTIDLFYHKKGFGYIDKDKYDESIKILYNLGIINKLFNSLNILYLYKN
ncbi:MAG: ABC transporter substrate-binding protein [Spirochaetes bacterium]|nr:ABC transporter substrate-binding protein [Spirochaetota bacterium]